MKTPVLFLVFNRRDTTKRVFEAIRAARPAVLFIAADGPRSNRLGEDTQCEEVRAIASNVDWPCEVHTRFRQENLGCGKGPADGITWFFEHVEEGIILEDDCLPSPVFFSFCEEMLERYRHDKRVMQIGGVNMLPPTLQESTYSYYFSERSHTWGWATWRRAWKLYDYNIAGYKEVMDKQYFRDTYNSAYEYDHFRWLYNKTYNDPLRVTWWDYQWEFAMKVNSGLAVVPEKNIIVNIGFGDHATHTTDPQGLGSGLAWQEMQMPLRHPEFVMPDKQKDNEYFIHNFTTVKSRFKSHVKRALPEAILKLWLRSAAI